MIAPRSALPTTFLLTLAAVAACSAVVLLDRMGGVAVCVAMLVIPTILLLPAIGIQTVQALSSFARQVRWWHLMWIISALSALTFRGRDIDQIKSSPLDFWAAYRIGLMLFISVMLLYHFDLGHVLGSVFRGRTIAMVGVYCAVSLASTLWSVYPSWTAYKVFEYCVDLCLIAGILRLPLPQNSLKSLFDCLWIYLAFILATVWMGVIIWPDEALNRGVGLIGIQIQGVFPAMSSNGVGDISATLGLVSLSRLQSRGWSSAHRTLYCTVLGICLVSLVVAQTRSAILGMIAGCLVVLLFSKSIGVTGWLIGGVGGLVMLASNAALTYFMRDQDVDRFMSLSGRTNWWEAALKRIMDHPIIGYGAYAGARFVALADLGSNTTSTIHNLYLDVLIGTGLLGLIPVVVALIWTWVSMIQLLIGNSLNRNERHLGIEAMALLALMTVRSFFTSNFVYHAALDFFLVLGFIECNRRRISARSRITHQVRLR